MVEGGFELGRGQQGEEVGGGGDYGGDGDFFWGEVEEVWFYVSWEAG